MAHRKREYVANGHEVTIQQVNDGGSISAWIDGYAAHIDSAIEYMTGVGSSDILPIGIPNKIEYLRESGEEWKAIETALAWMCDCHVYYCKKCDSFYDYNNVASTGFAGHKCGACDSEDKHCPDSSDGEHDDMCTNPRQRNNARVPTKYKCQHCGRTRRTVPTG